MITSEIKKNKVLKKITLGASAAIMAVGFATTFSAEAQTSGSGTAKTHQCVRTEFSSSVATLECKNSGTRCATVSEC